MKTVINVDKVAWIAASIIVVLTFFLNLSNLWGTAGWFMTSFYTWIFYIGGQTEGGKK